MAVITTDDGGVVGPLKGIFGCIAGCAVRALTVPGYITVEVGVSKDYRPVGTTGAEIDAAIVGKVLNVVGQGYALFLAVWVGSIDDVGAMIYRHAYADIIVVGVECREYHACGMPFGVEREMAWVSPTDG